MCFRMLRVPQKYATSTWRWSHTESPSVPINTSGAANILSELDFCFKGTMQLAPVNEQDSIICVHRLRLPVHIHLASA